MSDNPSGTADLDETASERTGYAISEDEACNNFDPEPPEEIPVGARAFTFNEIYGCPTMYARAGSPRRTKFPCDPAFYDVLKRWLADVEQHRPPEFGPIQSITSAGALVNKPGMHGVGRAFDLDQIEWASIAITPLAREHRSNDVSVRRRYLGLDAICRRWFLFVLDGHFNADHEDHIHQDTSGSVKLSKGAKSSVKFCQAVCNDLCGFRLAIDGDWGPKTEAAMTEAQRRSGVQGNLSQNSDAYRAWLGRVGHQGLRGLAL